MARRGFVLSGATLAAGLSANVTAGMAPSLVRTTVHAAMLVAAGNAVAISSSVLVLTQGVLRMMVLEKLRLGVVAACAFLVCTVGIGMRGVAGPTVERASDDAHDQTTRPITAEDRLPLTPMPTPAAVGLVDDAEA